MANKLLGVRSGEPIGKNWAKHFITHLDALRWPLIKPRIGRGYYRKILR